MSEPQLFWYEQKELKDPIAVIGLPSIGLVGSITSSYLSRELKLDVVAGVTYPDIQQYTLLQNGNAYPPIRVHAGPLPKTKKKKTVKAEGEVTEEVPKADCVIVAVGHNEYRSLSPMKLKKYFKEDRPDAEHVLIDVKSLYRMDELKASGMRFWRM